MPEEPLPPTWDVTVADLQPAGVSSSDGEKPAPRPMRAWQQNDPEPVDVSQVRDTGDRRWVCRRVDGTWYLRDIAGPIYTWDELLAVAGPVTEVRAAVPVEEETP